MVNALVWQKDKPLIRLIFLIINGYIKNKYPTSKMRTQRNTKTFPQSYPQPIQAMNCSLAGCLRRA
jgi:hypothetical protein